MSNNNRDINKKNSQIKKLSLEIEQMESENKKWVVNIEEIKEDIKNTQNIISKNNLVSKNASFQNLQKQTKSLAKEKARLTQKIDKSKETLAKERREIALKEETLSSLQQKKSAIKRSAPSPAVKN